MKYTNLSPEQLFEAGAHFGHQIKRWNPKMAKYIWGTRGGVHIIDLEKTVNAVETAGEALEKLVAAGKRVVLVGTKRQAKEAVHKVAGELKIPQVTNRWLGGIITNWKQIKDRINKLDDLKKKRESGELKKYTKREQLEFDREISKLEKFFGGLSKLEGAPEVLVVVDTHKERSAVKEAIRRGLVVIGICDTNSNPDGIEYVIPMNDDSTNAIDLVISALGQAIARGKQAKN